MGLCASAPARTELSKVSPPEQYPENGKKLRTDAKIDEVYEVGKTIGSGAFSKVKLVTDLKTGEQFACKVMALPKPGHRHNEHMSTRAAIMKEIDVLLDLEHPNVISMREYYVWHNRVYMIMELLRGGELLDAVVDKGHYSEDDARVVFVQLIRGVRYLHSMGVAHRDLKLDNLLLARPGDITSIKIADFGFAKKHTIGAALTTTCGTPEYMAPEVVLGVEGPSREYHEECDLWAAGVILYILLGGYPPFQDESDPRLFRKIKRGAYDFDDPVWSTISKEAKDLISRLLVVDPAQRLTATQVLQHPWLAPALALLPLPEAGAAAYAGAAAATDGATAVDAEPPLQASPESPTSAQHLAQTMLRLSQVPRRHSGTAGSLRELCEKAREGYARSAAGGSAVDGSPRSPRSPRSLRGHSPQDSTRGDSPPPPPRRLGAFSSVSLGSLNDLKAAGNPSVAPASPSIAPASPSIAPASPSVAPASPSVAPSDAGVQRAGGGAAAAEAVGT